MPTRSRSGHHTVCDDELLLYYFFVLRDGDEYRCCVVENSDEKRGTLGITNGRAVPFGRDENNHVFDGAERLGSHMVVR